MELLLTNILSFIRMSEIFKKMFTLKVLKKLKLYTSYQIRKHLVESPILSKIDYVMFHIKDCQNTKYKELTNLYKHVLRL